MRRTHGLLTPNFEVLLTPVLILLGGGLVPHVILTVSLVNAHLPGATFAVPHTLLTPLLTHLRLVDR